MSKSIPYHPKPAAHQLGARFVSDYYIRNGVNSQAVIRVTVLSDQMSEAQSVPNGEERTAHDLTAFQQNILTILGEEPLYGLAIKRELEGYYGNEVNHGRLYPNLDELVERDLIAKSKRDKRTNEYELTDAGYELLLGELNWELSKVVTDEDRADDLTQLLDNAA